MSKRGKSSSAITAKQLSQPPSSFPFAAMEGSTSPIPTTPTKITIRTSRIRTVSSPTQAKSPEKHDVASPATATSSSHSNLHIDTTRARRSSAFSIPKTFNLSSPLALFARRRKSVQPSIRSNESLGDVIEIGPDSTRREEIDSSVNEEDAERERLRDAAAQALGLGLGRETSTHDHPSDSPAAENEPPRPTSYGPLHHHGIPDSQPAPSSIVSLPQLPPSAPHDTLPSYPSTLSALTDYIQNTTTAYKYCPSPTFLTISLNRRAKQWKFRYVVLTSPPKPDLLSISHHDYPHRPLVNHDPHSMLGGDYLNMSGRHSHLHLFKNASPAPDEVEIDRLEINEDSVVYIAELEVAGKGEVLKVGGRDARVNAVVAAGGSVKSGTSWHGSMSTKDGNEMNVEEMGRTMWMLKISDGVEMHKWIGYIKTAILVQRAERAGMTFHPHIHSGVPSMRADLDVLLSLRTQGVLSNGGTITPPYSNSGYPGQTLFPPAINSSSTSGTTSTLLPSPSNSINLSTSTNTTAPAPAPNPRYAEHVGAAPSYFTSPSTSSLRARTYPSPSGVNPFQSLKAPALPIPSFKGMFSIPTPSSRPTSPISPPTSGGKIISSTSPKRSISAGKQKLMSSSPSHEEGKDIDPISEDVSLGNRAAALFGMFRFSNSQNSEVTLTPTGPGHERQIGQPISPLLNSGDMTIKARSRESSVGHHPAFSVDWSMANDGETGRNGIGSGLSPPPRTKGHKRPNTSGGSSEMMTKEKKANEDESGRPNSTDGVRLSSFSVSSPRVSVTRTNTTPPSLRGVGTPRASFAGAPTSVKGASGPPTPSINGASSPSIQGVAPATSSLTPDASPPSIHGLSPPPSQRPPSVNSISTFASERESFEIVERSGSIRREKGSFDLERSNSNSNPSSVRRERNSFDLERERRRSRGVPNKTPPSPIFEQASAPLGSSVSLWGSQHPYSNPKRISTNSAQSINTSSTSTGGHSFFGSKSPPPPRPPPNFAPPPAPPSGAPPLPPKEDAGPSNHRESFIPVLRGVRLSLTPPIAPAPTQSLPPRPDEPAYRHSHRRSNSSDTHIGARLSKLYSISGSPTQTQHPPQPPPPRGPLPPTPRTTRGPLPPTPDSVGDRDKEKNEKSTRRTSLTKRLRILSSPASTTTPKENGRSISPYSSTVRPSSPQSQPRDSSSSSHLMVEHGMVQTQVHHDGDTTMFLNLHDTPVTPAIPLTNSFIHVVTQAEEEDADSGPTPLSPPPRRSSRGSKEIRMNPHHLPVDKDEAKSPPHANHTLPEPQDVAVAL